EIYNVCSGKGLSIREIMSILTGLSSKTIETRQDTSKAGRSIRTMIGSPEKIRKATGWGPKIKIGQTLADTLDYWRQQLTAN
ncbi:MAG: GDP-mannose 4,6 dehydratase, partial [Candidatus Woesearchaeota archaeon]